MAPTRQSRRVSPSRSRIAATQWNLFFHYTAIVLMMVSGIVLVPLYLRFIALNVYGAWLASGNILMWLTAVDPGLATVLQQRVGSVYGQNDAKALAETIGSGVVLSLLVPIAVFVCGALAAPQVPNWIRCPSGVESQIITDAFLLAAIGTSLTVLSYSVTAINQGLLSSRGVGAIYTATHSADILISITLLLNGFGLMAIAIGFVTRGAGMAVGNTAYLIWRLRSERIGIRWSTARFRELTGLLSFSFLGRMSGVVAGNMDAFIVARFLGLEMVPVLALTRKGLDLARTLVERPPVAFMPAITHLAGEGQWALVRTHMVRLLTLMIWLVGLIFGGFFVFNDNFVGLWVGAHLFAGSGINLLLCLTMCLMVQANSLGNLCMALGNIRGVSLNMFFQSVLFITLMLIGGHWFGLTGIVVAPLISLAVVSGWYYPRALSRLLSFAPADHWSLIGEMGRVAAAVVGVSLVFHRLEPGGWVAFGGSAAVYAASYGAVLLVLSSRLRAEAARLARMLRTKKEHNER